MIAKIIQFFKSKGVIATMIGLLFSLPVNSRAVYSFFNNIELDEKALTAIVVFNIIGMCWFILPSKISIKASKFEFIIED